MQSEVAEAAAGPQTSAQSVKGGPTLLVPSGTPPPVRSVSPPTTPPVPARPVVTPPPSRPTSQDVLADKQRAVREALPPQEAAAVGVSPAGAAPQQEALEAPAAPT